MIASVESFIKLVFEQSSSQRKFLSKSLLMLSSEEEQGLASYIEYSQEEGVSSEQLAEAYLTIVDDTRREQLFFRRHLRYRHSSLSAVANSVYFNIDYMEKYMHGLALSLYLWPNHLTIKRFFDEHIPRNNTGTYLEIGPGHGMFFMTAMRLSAYQFFLGVDISPTSAQMTRDILGSSFFGDFKDYNIIEQDFTNWKHERLYDAIVMGEVLEHVENPVAMLKNIAKLAAPGAFIFVTTCIDAPVIDHIYLYESMEQIEDEVQLGGMQIVKHLLVPYEGFSVEVSHENRLPVNVAMILEKVDK